MIKSKTLNVACVGLDFFNYYYIDIIKNRIGRDVDCFKCADEALEGILQREYPIIIVSTTIAPGNFKGGRVNGIGIHYPQVSMDLIKQIRIFDGYRITPIIAIGPTNTEYTPSQEYLNSGATGVFVGFDNTHRDFERLIKRFLN